MFLWLSVSHRLSAAELQLEAGMYEATTMPQRGDLLEMNDKRRIFLVFNQDTE